MYKRQFPLRCEGRICGALAVYSPQPGMFGTEEEALMVELSLIHISEPTRPY